MPFHPYASGSHNDNIFNYCNPTYNQGQFLEGFSGQKTCRAISPQASDSWCNSNCNHEPPNCPTSMCKCEGGESPTNTSQPPQPTRPHVTPQPPQPPGPHVTPQPPQPPGPHVTPQPPQPPGPQVTPQPPPPTSQPSQPTSQPSQPTSQPSGTGGDVASLITNDMWTKIFPNQTNPACKTGPNNTSSILNHDNFVKACSKFPQFGKTKIEIAAFLANMTQENYGGWATAPGGELAWGGCLGSEASCYKGPNSTTCTQYNSPSCPGMNSGAGYYGRGPLQLTYCANYEAAGKAIGQDLLKDPNILVNNGVAAFEASIWFWTTFNQASCCGGAVQGKTCHDVITQDKDFTKTVAIINGGIECGIENTDSLPRTEFLRRNRAFQRICGILGVTPPPCGTTCNSWAGNGKCYESPS